MVMVNDEVQSEGTGIEKLETLEEWVQQAPQMLYAPVPFEDDEGNAIPTWRVPLEAYLEGHEGIPGDWRWTHMLVIARALAFGQPVPSSAVDGHDPYELRLLELRERCVCNGDKAAWEELKSIREAGAC